MTDVLVFGGAGFIGSSLMSALEDRGARAFCADLRAPERPWEHELVNVGSRDEVDRIVARTQPRVVINLAYRLADASSIYPDPAFTVNVTGAQNVLEAVRAHGVRRFVLGSSIAVYGDQSAWGEHALAETDERRPVRPYGWQKALNEVMAEQYAAIFGVEAIAFRISTVWGVGRTVGLSAPITDLIDPPAGAHTVISPWPLDEAFDLVHRDDAAAALADLALAEKLEHPTYNSGGEYATVSDLAHRLGRLRPEVTVRVAEPATSIRHCSRIDSSRLRDTFGARPRRIFAD